MLRMPFWLALAVLVGRPAQAQDTVAQSCEKTKTDLQKQGAACADEAAQAAKVACKTTDDLNAVIKLFTQCGSKKLGAASASSAAPGAGGSKSARTWKCRAVDPGDNKDIAEASAGRMMECAAALKEKVKATACASGKNSVEYLNQTEVAGKWSKGTKISVTCK